MKSNLKIYKLNNNTFSGNNKTTLRNKKHRKVK